MCVGVVDVTRAETHFNLGLAYRRQGHSHGAIQEFWAALRIDSNCAKVYYGLSVVCRRWNRLAERPAARPSFPVR